MYKKIMSLSNPMPVYHINLFSNSICYHRLVKVSFIVRTKSQYGLTSREWTFVLKLLNLTDSTLPLSIKCGSASPQVDGTATSPDSLVYASNVNVPIYQRPIRHYWSLESRDRELDLHSSCKIGKKVVVLVICFIISLISP